jgi:hypothetical protein
MVRKYVRWVYVPEAEYQSTSPKADHPWNRLSKHFEAICQQLSEK